ncbi:MAG: HD domain-containing protein [Pseudomonadota bacterium]
MVAINNIVNLLFEARMLKEIRRSGYRFLGSGNENVAEHTFIVTFILYVMAQMVPGVDALKLISMGLLHDLAETRIGDLDMVQKQYVTADENKVIRHMVEGLPFGASIKALAEEFNAGETTESKLARDADQLAFILDLKTMKDRGYVPASWWLDAVKKRLKTEAGRQIGAGIMNVGWDEWWRKNILDISE